MSNVKVRAFQKSANGEQDASFEMEIKGKVTNFESAVATGVEETLRWLKLMRELGAKSGFSSRLPLHFAISRDNVPLCDTSDPTVFDSKAYGVLKVPANSPKARAAFRKRMKLVFEYAYSDKTVLKSFKQFVEVESVPAQAQG